MVAPAAAVADIMWMAVLKCLGSDHRWARHAWLVSTVVLVVLMYACLLGRMACAAWKASSLTLSFADDTVIAVHLSGGVVRLIVDGFRLASMGVAVSCLLAIRCLHITAAALIADPFAFSFSCVAVWLSRWF